MTVERECGLISSQAIQLGYMIYDMFYIGWQELVPDNGVESFSPSLTSLNLSGKLIKACSVKRQFTVLESF